MIARLRQLNINLLHIYMIVALLFLTSVTLHIHTQEAAVFEDHGAAVSISSIADDFSSHESLGEIVVSPESVLKLKQNDTSLFAVFLLIAVIVAHHGRSHSDRLRKSHASFPVIPFYGAPLLRAPPL